MPPSLPMPAAPDKPPYRVPSMSEIGAVPWNGFNVVSTFSGCGGSSLGYKMAGFKVLWANEFIPAAQDTYRLNHPETILDTRDIRTVQPQDILDAIGLSAGELDVFDGSPPCASFSTAGKREEGWGKVKAYSDTKQRVDDLFFEYARLVKGVRPKVFIAENVSGLVKGTAKGYFLEILRQLKSCGYDVSAKVLDAQWLGVPQMRSRLIFVGVRSDLSIRPSYPDPLPYRYSIRDACPWISGVTYASAIPPVEPETDISRFAIGSEWDNLKVGQQSEKYFNLVRSAPNRPCGAVTTPNGSCSAAKVVHPFEKRHFSIAELRRIGSFPDDFILTGSYSQQWERIGRAVPPVMMAAVASHVRDNILCRLPK